MIQFRYLVRELKIIEGGDIRSLSLQYINFTEGHLEIFPFDYERAGYAYLQTLILERTGDNSYELHSKN